MSAICSRCSPSSCAITTRIVPIGRLSWRRRCRIRQCRAVSSSVEPFSADFTTRMAGQHDRCPSGQSQSSRYRSRVLAEEKERHQREGDPRRTPRRLGGPRRDHPSRFGRVDHMLKATSATRVTCRRRLIMLGPTGKSPFLTRLQRRRGLRPARSPLLQKPRQHNFG